MAINYPPMIGDTIPAFFSEKLIIPFSHNIAVNQNNVKGFKLKIKNLSDSSEIATIN